MAVLSNTGIRGGASGVVAEPAAYTVKRSARFNDGDSAYLNWTPATSGNRRTWTWSGWVKRGTLPGTSANMGLFSQDSNCYFRFSDDNGGDSFRFVETGNDNLISQRLFRDTSAWYHVVVAVDSTQGTDSNRIKVYINNEQITDWQTSDWPGINHDFDINNGGYAHQIARCQTSSYYDGLMTDIHFIDGQQLAATDFGETDSTTGQWKPKEYEGSYGTNGFHLAMDPANSGTNYSQYGATIGINSSYPWSKAFDGITDGTYGNGAGAADGAGYIKWEPASAITVSSSLRLNTDNGTAAIKVNGSAVTTSDGWTTISGISSLSSIEIYNSGSDWTYLCGVEVDGKVLVDHTTIGYDSSGNKNHWHENNLFGREQLIANGNFKAVQYTGTGSAQTINCGFQPDFVWLKSSSNAYSHSLYDSVRGVTQRIQANDNAAEGAVATGLTAFTSTGFTIGSDIGINGNGNTQIAWCWKAGGAASSNSDGSGTSSVSANPDAGFSIVKYTGTGASATWGHGLGKEPEFIMIKDLDGTNDWNVYHKDVGYSKAMKLNDNSIPATPGAARISATSSTTFTTGSAAGECNASGTEYIAYCWTSIDGYSKFSSFVDPGALRIELGFWPGLWINKRTDAASAIGDGWGMFDKHRSKFDNALWAQDAGTGGTGWGNNEKPNGFTWGGGSYSDGDYISMAWAGDPAEQLDLLADVPGAPYDNELNGGGNYATLNTLNRHSASNDSTADGNLKAIGTSSSANLIPSTIAFSSGKYYYEVEWSDASAPLLGIRRSDSRNYDNMYAYHGDGKKYTNGGSDTAYGATYTTGDIIGCAVDMDAGTLRFYKNGADQGQAFSGISGEYTFCQGVFGGTTSTYTVNFGQRTFAYTPPAGYKALNVYNLSDPTITKGNTGFEAKIYTGNHSTVREVTYEFGPDLFWSKRRDDSNSHNLYDSVRGDNKYLQTDNTNAEGTDSGACVFGTDKVTLSTTRSNENGVEFATWAWDAGTTTVTNDASSTGVGTHDSTYRVNTNTGFSIVTGTSDSTANTVMSYAHGLNAKPKFIIGRNRNPSGAVNWSVQHGSMGATKRLELNNNSVVATNHAWGDTEPTSTVFYTKSGTYMYTGTDCVWYLWSEVAGYSKFGSYEGNNNSDGTFVWCGFKPAFVMVKNIDATQNWVIVDSVRDPDNVAVATLRPNSDLQEYSNNDFADFLSNGFKFRGTEAQWNNSETYVFAAFAESPFKYSNAV